MLKFTDKGMYCQPGKFYIDPWRPVDKALITHGHSDHARWGSKAYLCQHDTKPILKLRLGADISVESVSYGEPISINGVKVSFHPAGHIIGSAQIRMEYKGEIWVVTGDYKLADDGISAPFELVKCHHFVTESTFGLPIYRFDPPEKTYAEINQWWAQNAANGINTVLLGYALGKSQAILNALDPGNGPIFLHGAVANVNDALTESGYHFPGSRITAETDRKSIQSALIMAPPSAFGTPWLRKLAPYKVAMCSGWMALRGARRRKGVDKGFALSDHCDWNQLNEAILATGAEHVYVTHGYESAFSRWVREVHQLSAYEVKTLFHEGEDEDL
ncbi:ligase-associated DNA damage response exonuclease [Fluviicola sp.]|uniref:ligase-associated DNA damage response exonuclease n=1 Tax=Fluviicola sp. TaxID=1917219 RepID=UPI0031D8A190